MVVGVVLSHGTFIPEKKTPEQYTAPPASVKRTCPAREEQRPGSVHQAGNVSDFQLKGIDRCFLQRLRVIQIFLLPEKV